MADGGRILDGLQSGREAFPLPMAEVTVLRTCGDDERVEGDCTGGQEEAFACRVDANGAAEQRARILLLPEQAAHRCRDVAG